MSHVTQDSDSPTGPFSGVNLTGLLQRPMLESHAVLEAEGRELARYGSGMRFEEREGRTVAVILEGFSLRFRARLSPGDYCLALQGHGPLGDACGDLVLFVNGDRVPLPLRMPSEPIRDPSTAFHLPDEREYEFVLKLEKDPGSIIRGMRLARRSVKIVRSPMREELVGKHPRLFFTSDDLDALRSRLDRPRVGLFYELPPRLSEKPPPFRTGPGARNGQAWIPLKDHALACLLQPDDERITAILEWLEMATTYDTVGLSLDSGYYMEGLALTYDWMYPYMSDGLREGVRDAIARQCRSVFAPSQEGRTAGGGCIQAHRYFFANMSLSLGAAAVYGEVPEAEHWLAWGWDRLERIVMSICPDGGHHEGPGYWEFGMPRLFMFVDIYEWCSGLHIPAGDESFRRQTEWRAQHMFPGFKLTAAFEDVGRNHSLPDTKLLLWGAKRYSDPVAMGLAEALNKGPCSDAFNLLWLDENLAPSTPQEAAPLMSRFNDLGMVFARTSWGDDATYFAITSRPIGGQLQARLNVEQKLPGGCFHSHPAQNHFILFGRGRELAGDPGYSIKKETKNHNTILVDGHGQYADGVGWPPPNAGRAEITDVSTDADITIATADATRAYPPELGLLRFERTMVLAGRDIVLVCDRLATREPRTFSWRLHHYGDPPKDTSPETGSVTFVKGEARMDVVALLPSGVSMEVGPFTPGSFPPNYEGEISQLVQFRQGPVAEGTFLVALLVGDKGTTPPKIDHSPDETHDEVRIGDTLIAFNRSDSAMSIVSPWGEDLTTPARTVVAQAKGGERRIVTSPVV